MYAAKIDLKNAYFHLELNDALKPFVSMQIGEKYFRFQAAAFGISSLPHLWMQVMKVFLRKWRQAGIQVFVYLDDILLLGANPDQVSQELSVLLQDLQDAGMVINYPKSILHPVQEVTHLGFVIDLKNGQLLVLPRKVKSVCRELGKIVLRQQISPRKMAAILGVVRSFLCAMPFLRASTDHMLNIVNQHCHTGWDQTVSIPEDLRMELKYVKTLLDEWPGRPFEEGQPSRKLFSDSSDDAWAGVDPENNKVVQEFWRETTVWHINVKEIQAQ